MAEETERNTLGWIWIAVIAIGIILFLALQIPNWLNPRYPGIRVEQKAQFHSISAALELFCNEFDSYPPSDANDPVGKPYCGAMKLAEAMMGQDMVGFHGEAVFRGSDGKDASGVAILYDPTGDLTARKGPYLPPESADCIALADIFGSKKAGPFDPDSAVLCDVYTNRRKTGKKVGMPVLYYKADTSKNAHDTENPDNPDNIYNYRDNHALLALGVPGEPEKQHPLFTDPTLFYRMTKSDKITTVSIPSKAGTFILISAGLDGLYGTPDDICNFDWKFPD